jgi:hypothetical protein
MFALKGGREFIDLFKPGRKHVIVGFFHKESKAGGVFETGDISRKINMFSSSPIPST